MMRKKEPDYVALKKPGDDFYTWFDRSKMRAPTGQTPASMARIPNVVTYHSSGEFITRENGDVAEIWKPKAEV